MDYCLISFESQVVPYLASGSPFMLASVPFFHVITFKTLSYFWAHRIFQIWLVLTSALESAISTPVSGVFRSHNLYWGVLIMIEMALSPFLLSRHCWGALCVCCTYFRITYFRFTFLDLHIHTPFFVWHPFHLTWALTPYIGFSAPSLRRRASSLYSAAKA